MKDKRHSVIHTHIHTHTDKYQDEALQLTKERDHILLRGILIYRQTCYLIVQEMIILKNFS